MAPPMRAALSSEPIGQERVGRLARVKRLIAPAVLVLGLALAAGAAIANTGGGADAAAVAQASALIPGAHWTVTGRSFDPWGSEVDYGTLQLTNVAGPSWVVKLAAPGYQAAVVINAFTGDVTDSGAARTG